MGILDKSITTDCGMWALWDYAAYEQVDSYDAWQENFCEDEDIARQVETGRFVPVNIRTDGCFAFRVKVDEPLDDREREYVAAASGEYLFRTEGTAVLSGLENVTGAYREVSAITLSLPAGSYSAQVFLIDWEKEPGARIDEETPSPDALPDFVLVLTSGADETRRYRTALDTFN